MNLKLIKSIRFLILNTITYYSLNVTLTYFVFFFLIKSQSFIKYNFFKFENCKK